MKPYIGEEAEYYVVYNFSEVWGKFPVMRTKRKEEAELMLKYLISV